MQQNKEKNSCKNPRFSIKIYVAKLISISSFSRQKTSLLFKCICPFTENRYDILRKTEIGFAIKI